MPDISDIVVSTAHRPFEIPAGAWRYYQEWNDALFLHWKVPFDNLRKVVPGKLDIDTFDGCCYVSLVAFTMQNIRPRYLPAVSLISDFDEINLRTYVNNGGKPGVYFISIEGAKLLSVVIAKLLSGLPYERTSIKRSGTSYTSINRRRSFHLDTEFVVKDQLRSKNGLDKWLTERYCLYLHTKENLYRYEVHHKEWEIRDVEVRRLKLNYRISDLDLSVRPPDLAHYSDGVKVVAWGKQRI